MRVRPSGERRALLFALREGKATGFRGGVQTRGEVLRARGDSSSGHGKVMLSADTIRSCLYPLVFFCHLPSL